jgi:SAM-dependent methyltransferase
MKRALYDHPTVYDALHAGKPYDEEVAFVLDRMPAAASRALVVGCGTGEHARRLHDAGLDVVGVDPSPAMIGRARERSDVEFLVGALPELPIDGRFDLVVAPFTVTNYLAPDELEPALAALSDRVADGGVLVLDTGDFPEMDAPALQTAAGPEGDCARLFQFRRLDDRRVRMDALVFHGSSWFVDRHELTAFDDETIALSLAERGFVVKRQDWYTDRTITTDPSVFVARRA